MDVVYPLKKDASKWDDNEIKYSLRSLRNIKFDKVFIIGYKPNFLNDEVIHIQKNDIYENKQTNVIEKIMTICKDERVSDDFILMNDDFYFLEPQEVNILIRGKLENMGEFTLKSKYGYSLREAVKWLKERNLETNSYEVHYPMIYNKQKFLDLFSQIDYKENPILHRSVYGNYYNVPYKEDVKDFKVFNLKDFAHRNEKFLSTNNEIPFLIRKFIKEKLINKSKFEI